jgi:TIR domain
MKEINPLIKPLIADLLKLGIGNYFTSTTFHRNLIKINLHEYWDKISKNVKNYVPGQHLLESENVYIKRLQEAVFIEVLNIHIEPNQRNSFFNLTQSILIGWINHSKITTKKFSDVLEDLKVIKFPDHFNRIKIELAKNDNMDQVPVLEIEKKVDEKSDGKVDKQDSKIFISHSSIDKNIIDKFVEKVLQLSLKIPDGDIFCSSIEGLGITTGKDFREVIKDKITKASLVIIFLSENYKKSEICLNEMGAAWVLSKDVIPILIPPVTFKEVGPLHITGHHDSIEGDSSLDNILNSIKQVLGIKEEINFQRWNKHKKDILDSTKK